MRRNVSADREALALLGRHQRGMAAHVARNYAASARTSQSNARSEFWTAVAVLLESDEPVEIVEARVRAAQDMRNRRSRLIAALEAMSPPPGLVSALSAMSVVRLETIVGWLQSRSGVPLMDGGE